ncbi:MAG TPA: transposase [Leptolyngbyaceae cyanobacterium M33_DOE_097]|nr:transposase [Leptolyngbyaceae cyanobacterium M33_DOE_097]
MQLNPLGNAVRSHWLKLQYHHAHLQLDAWVVMPNHIHGILVLPDNLRAGLAKNVSVETRKIMPKPTPTDLYHEIPEIIRGFKAFSARYINKIRRARGIPVWQRNYYEHIIRNEESLQFICRYIYNNAIAWQNDQLHPANPSKW